MRPRRNYSPAIDLGRPPVLEAALEARRSLARLQAALTAEGRISELGYLGEYALCLHDLISRDTTEMLMMLEPPRDSGEADAVNGPTALKQPERAPS